MQHLTATNASLRQCLTHIILDEVHERDLHTDIPLKLVKDLLNTNLHVKIVLMSATISSDLFTNHFGNHNVKISKFESENELFDLSEYELNDENITHKNNVATCNLFQNKSECSSEREMKQM